MHDNLAYRREVINRGNDDPAYAQAVKEACRQDILFWVNTFVFAFDSRQVGPGRHPISPFITYESYQDRVLLDLAGAIGQEDIMMEKSRDMGASWLCLLAILHRWHFMDYQTFLLASRVEDLVDKTEDPDSLFWKLLFVLEKEPWWLKPGYVRTSLHLLNLDQRCTIDGCSTTGNIGRGGRRTAILLDEVDSVEDWEEALAATQHATTCRIFNSTPKGTGRALYHLRQTDIRRLRLHWMDHPAKRAGLYRSAEGRVEILDQEYPFPDDYKFITDGRLRSPYYDGECARAVHEQQIRQELDIDFLASDYPFFDTETLERLVRQDCRSPDAIGIFDFDLIDGSFLNFREHPDGPLWLWQRPDIVGRMPDDRRYAIGVDVAEGTGATASAISVADRRQHAKVAAMRLTHTPSHKLADVVRALGLWFKGSDPSGAAEVIYEANGPGRSFGAAMLDYEYPNLYWRESGQGVVRKRTDVPGFWSTKDSKRELLSEYRTALAMRRFINRDQASLNECQLFHFFPDGSVDHATARSKMNPAGARENHADMVIADALASKLVRGLATLPERPRTTPPNTFAHRREQRRTGHRLPRPRSLRRELGRFA